MARNKDKDYILKIMSIKAPNGYKFDFTNYLLNPHIAYDYPSFKKTISEDEETATIRRVYYFKYYNGTGEYREEIFTEKKNGDTWQVVHNRTEKVLAESKRFSLKKLITFC